MSAVGAFASYAQAASPMPPNLLTAPLYVTGNWGGSLPQSAERVVRRMRQVCLEGLPLLSDQQPRDLRVDDHAKGSPAVWLHDDLPETAWIIVDIGGNAWCQLSYQFGHELGHVLCNSWRHDANPGPPCQWLEEALVEAFSIRGLGLLAPSWAHDPPFPGDSAYASAIKDYRNHLITRYRSTGVPAGDDNFRDWFQTNRDELLHNGGATLEKGPAILHILAQYERETPSVADLGALNRWPGRSHIPLAEYLSRWQASCAEIAAPGLLPRRLREVMDIG
jgi:hypothetical protein